MIGLREIRLLPRMKQVGFYLGLASLACVPGNAVEPAPAAQGNSAEARLSAVRMPVLDPNGPAVAAIYVEYHGLRPGATGPQLIMALWENGLVIWSSDQEIGGPPYFSAPIPWITARLLAKQLDDQNVFDDTVRDDRYFGPDSTCTTLAICTGSHRLNMSSWHEHFERNENLVALAGGVTALNGRRRDDALAEEPEEYRRFRAVWKTVRSALTGVIPKKGSPLEQLTFTLEPQPPAATSDQESTERDPIGERFGQPMFRGETHSVEMRIPPASVGH